MIILYWLNFGCKFLSHVFFLFPFFLCLVHFCVSPGVHTNTFFLFFVVVLNTLKQTKNDQSGLIGLLSSAGVGDATGQHHHGHPRHHLPPLGDLVSLGLVNPTSGWFETNPWLPSFSTSFFSLLWKNFFLKWFTSDLVNVKTERTMFRCVIKIHILSLLEFIWFSALFFLSLFDWWLCFFWNFFSICPGRFLIFALPPINNKC